MVKAVGQKCIPEELPDEIQRLLAQSAVGTGDLELAFLLDLKTVRAVFDTAQQRTLRGTISSHGGNRFCPKETVKLLLEATGGVAKLLERRSLEYTCAPRYAFSEKCPGSGTNPENAQTHFST